MRCIPFINLNKMWPAIFLIGSSLTYVNTGKFVSADSSFIAVIFLLSVLPLAYYRVAVMKKNHHSLAVLASMYAVMLMLVMFEIYGQSGYTRLGPIYFLMESSVIYSLLVNNKFKEEILRLYVIFHIIIIYYGLFSEFLYRLFGVDYLSHQTLFISNRMGANIDSGRGYISVYQEPTVLALNAFFLLILVRYIKGRISTPIIYTLLGFMIVSRSLTGMLLTGAYVVVNLISARRRFGVKIVQVVLFVVVGVQLLAIFFPRFEDVSQTLIAGNFFDNADESLRERLGTTLAIICVANNSFYGLSSESLHCLANSTDSFADTYGYVTGGVLRLLTSGGWPLFLAYSMLAFRRLRTSENTEQVILMILFLTGFALFPPMSLSTFAVAFVVVHTRLDREKR